MFKQNFIVASKHLSLCDYFLYGYLKCYVFEHRPRTLDALQPALCLPIGHIPRQILCKTMLNFRTGVHQCIDNDISYKTYSNYIEIISFQLHLLDVAIKFCLNTFYYFIIYIRSQGYLLAPPVQRFNHVSMFSDCSIYCLSFGLFFPPECVGQNVFQYL